MHKLKIVAADTYLRQIKSWSFVILVLAPFLFAALSLGLGYVSATSAVKHDKVAVVAQNKALRQAVLKQFDQDERQNKITTVAQAKRGVKANRIKGYLVITQDQRQIQAQYRGDQNLGTSQVAQVKQVLSQYQTQLNVQAAGLTAKQWQQLQQQPQLTQSVSQQTSQAKTGQKISFYVLVFMVYMIIITYSSITAQEIASEKGTKIMEVIFSSTTAAKYFCGKILGMLGVILTQIVIYLVGGGLCFLLAQRLDKLQPVFTQFKPLIHSVLHNLVSINLIFLLLGVVLYTILAAFSGALVAKAEDAPKAAYPATYLSMFAFFISFPFQDNAGALTAKILSYVPFFSSYFMPVRLIAHNANLVEASVSLLLLLATILGLTWYISRIYQGLILQADEGSFWKRFKRGLAYH